LDPVDGNEGNDKIDSDVPGKGRFAFRFHIEYPNFDRKGSNGCPVMSAEDLKKLQEFLKKTKKGPKKKILSQNAPTPQNPEGKPDNFGRLPRLGTITVTP
jgi:hypothetical protein